MLLSAPETKANGFHRGREPYFDPKNFEKLAELLGRPTKLFPEMSLLSECRILAVGFGSYSRLLEEVAKISRNQ